MRRFSFILFFMLSVSAVMAQLPSPVLNHYYNDKTASAINGTYLLQPEVGIAKDRISFMDDGLLVGIGTVLTEEVVMDNAVNTTSSTNAALRNFLITTAATLEVASSSADDASAGTGARTIVINGLDSDYAPLSETVTLTGQTVAVTTGEFLRINEVYVATAGTGGKNAGVIYIALDDTFTSGVPQTAAKILQAIPIGNNRASNAYFTVPDDTEMYIRSIKVSSSTAQIGKVHLYIKEYGELVQKRATGGFYQNQIELIPGKNAIKVDEKADIFITADAAAASVVGVVVDYVLIDK